MKCQDCGVDLSDDNWTPSNQKYKRYICSKCWIVRQKKYSQNDPDFAKKRLLQTRQRRDSWSEERKTEEADKRYGRWLKRKYGITLEKYKEMLSLQNGRCAICKTDKPDGVGRFHVDHCHTTGKIRGLLCSTCNLCLGKMQDSVDRLQAAIQYLLGLN